MTERVPELTTRITTRHGRRRTVAAVAVGAAALVGVAACGSSTSNSAKAGPSAVSTTAAVPASPGANSGSGGSGLATAQAQLAKYEKPVTSYPAPGPALDGAKVSALKGKTVLFVPDGLVGPFILAQQAVSTALGHVGVSLKTCDPNFLPPQVAACFAQAKTDGAAAVITSGIPYNLATQAYQTLESQHIPVLVAAAGLGSPANTQDIAFQSEVAATSLAGTLGADEVIADSNGKANVLFVSATGASGVEAQAAATKTEFTKLCPGCKVSSVSADGADTAHLASAVSSQLISNPSTDYVLAQSDALLPNILPGIQSANFTTKVKIVSGAGAAAVLQMIQQHHGIIADSAFDASFIGWNAADGVLRLLTGVSVPSSPFLPVRVFTPENLSGLQLSAAMDVNPLYGPASFQQMFFDLWAGKSA